MGRKITSSTTFFLKPYDFLGRFSVMKIKPASRRHLEKARLRARNWIPEEEVKQRGRLAQLAKHNRKKRTSGVLV